MNKALQRTILLTLAYFDTFDYPLTLVEIHRWLWKPDGKYNIQEVDINLRHLLYKQKIFTQDGFYFFENRKEIVNKRQDAVLLVNQKIKIAKKAARILTCIPFVHAMFVCNTVAGSIPSKKSDIDVLIVINDNHLWVTRLLITLLLSIFKLKRTKHNIHNKICLSFYITKSNSNFAELQLSKPDIYLAYWIDQLVPIYDDSNYLKKLFLDNMWVHKKLPNALNLPRLHSNWVVSNNISSQVIRFIISLPLLFFSSYQERFAKYIQKIKMDKNTNSLQDEPDSRVIVSDTMLKFHENDRRNLFKQRWQDRCNELDI